MKIFKIKFATGKVLTFLSEAAAKSAMENLIGKKSLECEWVNEDQIEATLKLLANQ